MRRFSNYKSECMFRRSRAIGGRSGREQVAFVRKKIAVRVVRVDSRRTACRFTFVVMRILVAVQRMHQLVRNKVDRKAGDQYSRDQCVETTHNAKLATDFRDYTDG